MSEGTLAGVLENEFGLGVCVVAVFYYFAGLLMTPRFGQLASLRG